MHICGPFISGQKSPHCEIIYDTVSVSDCPQEVNAVVTCVPQCTAIVCYTSNPLLFSMRNPFKSITDALDHIAGASNCAAALCQVKAYSPQ